MKGMLSLIFVVILFASGAVRAHGDEEEHKKDSAARHEDHATALGRPGNPKKISRTIEITMSDAMRFDPASVSIKRGETIRFLLKNEGKLKHEMVLGRSRNSRNMPR